MNWKEWFEAKGKKAFMTITGQAAVTDVYAEEHRYQAYKARLMDELAVHGSEIMGSVRGRLVDEAHPMKEEQGR